MAFPIAIFGSTAPPRVLKVLDIVAAGFNICNSWCGLAATLFLGIIAGGPVTIIYGIIVCTFTVGCCALSLAELAARYPTAGGQYHWTWLIAPERFKRGASYATGMINIFAWLAISASVCVIIPNIVLGLAAYWNPTFVPQKYQSFLLYQVSNLLVLAYNIAILRRASWTHNVGMVFSLLCFLTFFIACLAKASPKLPSSYVWSTFVNEGTGWSNGVVFLTGLTNPNFMYVGIDGAIHLAEDAVNATTAVPWALCAAVVIGFVTAFPFVIAMFYCISDPTAVLQSPVPIFAIWGQAVKSFSGATVMTAFLLLTGYFSLNACQQTASRLTWSFARDKALVFSNHIGRIHPGLGVPVWALIANAVVVFVMGCIYLGSTVAFNAIVGTCLILMHVTIAIPILFLMASGRDSRFLPEKGHWNMGVAGWLFNFISVIWALIVLVFYCFPATNPTSGSAMNYASAVLGVMALFGAVNWFVYARRHYEGPQINLVRLMELHVNQ